jgi:hypothetical protein
MDVLLAPFIIVRRLWRAEPQTKVARESPIADRFLTTDKMVATLGPAWRLP